MRKRKINTLNGSSTVLVILIMLTVIVFGVLAMLASYSGFRLSKKNSDTTKERYLAESKGAEMLAILDEKLKAQNLKAFEKEIEKDFPKTEVNLKKNSSVIGGNDIIITIPYSKKYGDRYLRISLTVLDNSKEVESKKRFNINYMKEMYNAPVPDEGIGFQNPFADSQGD